MGENQDCHTEERQDLGKRMIAAFAASVVSLRSPEVAVAAFTLTPLFEVFAGRALAEWQRDGTRRSEDMFGFACEAAGLEPEELAGRAAETEEARLLTAKATAGAFATAWPRKVRALGRLLGEGLIASDDAVDLREHALPAMLDMERLHVEVLDLLVRHGPRGGERGVIAEPRKPSPLGDRWSPPRPWQSQSIGLARPHLRQVLTGLLGTLQRHGLAVETDNAADVLTRLLQRQNTQPVVVAWSPTQFGQGVLGFYDVAAAEV
jgi:hypothetical protein